MNLCFVSGIIISDIEFKFIIESKYISVCYFTLQLKNKSSILVKGHNEMADFCYHNLSKYDKIIVQGKLNNKMEIIISEIQL